MYIMYVSIDHGQSTVSDMFGLVDDCFCFLKNTSGLIMSLWLRMMKERDAGDDTVLFTSSLYCCLCIVAWWLLVLSTC